MSEVALRKEQSLVTLPATSADNFIAQAIQSGASPETLTSLLALKERYDAIEAKKAYIAAMQKFQSMKPELKKVSKVKFDTSKGTTEYSFCSLVDIEKALKQPLTDCGLSYRFENFTEGGAFGVRCIVTHEQGHSESTQMCAPADTSGNKNVIQAIGSTSTYLMRYSLISSFALVTADTDDDGAANSDLPLKRVIDQSKALHDLDTFRAVCMLKEALAEGELDSAVMTFHSLSQDTVAALWVAPTKGGVFTTKEIATIKSDEFSAKRRDYATKLAEQEKV